MPGKITSSPNLATNYSATLDKQLNLCNRVFLITEQNFRKLTTLFSGQRAMVQVNENDKITMLASYIILVKSMNHSVSLFTRRLHIVSYMATCLWK